MKYSKYLFLLLISCSHQVEPVEGRPGIYMTHYCADEADCFEAMKKQCPNGYRVIKYSAHPELFRCE